MASPKPLPLETVPAALKQAHHYRLLNEPALAESICRDIVAVDDNNEIAWITLLLALTDQFDEKYAHALDHAKECLGKLQTDFHRLYYEGIIYERWARAQQKKSIPLETIESWVRNAMRFYDQSAELAPADDPHPVLRWNTCARYLDEIEQKRPQTNSPGSMRDMHNEFGDDVPFR